MNETTPTDSVSCKTTATRKWWQGWKIDKQQAGEHDDSSAKAPSTGMIRNWIDLCKRLDQAIKDEDKESLEKIESDYPYQTLFLVGLKDSDSSRKSYFHDIPFNAPADETIDLAQEYADNPSLPKMLRILMPGAGGGASGQYTNLQKEIVRRSDAGLDQIIISVAAVLKGRRVQSMEQLAHAAFDAIKHYSTLPLVRYFATLPYSRHFLQNKIVADPLDREIFIYRVVESLIYELYDELKEREVITDERFTKKIKRVLSEG